MDCKSTATTTASKLYTALHIAEFSALFDQRAAHTTACNPASPLFATHRRTFMNSCRPPHSVCTSSYPWIITPVHTCGAGPRGDAAHHEGETACLHREGRQQQQ